MSLQGRKPRCVAEAELAPPANPTSATNARSIAVFPALMRDILTALIILRAG